MYGRMQFADYLVSLALQTLNRCLLKVASTDELSCKDERLLLEQISHLQSIWQMLQWSVGKVVHAEASARLREIAVLINSPSPPAQAAVQLLDYADDRLKPQLKELGEKVAEDWVSPVVTGGFHWEDRRDRLSTLLQEESACWRDYVPLRRVPDEELIEHGMGRAYRKAERLSRRLDAVRGEDRSPPGPKRLMRTSRWVGHTANHLDLIRSALDDGARAQRWHLRRLHGKIEQQVGLELFRRYVVEQDMKSKPRQRLEKLLTSQRRHLDKQRRKLMQGAFVLTPRDYVRQSFRSVENLSLQEITLLPLDAAT